MPIRKKTIGVGFPFKDSTDGDYLQMNTTISQEVKSNFIHLLMTTKGERYFLPQFGTNLRQFLFDPQSSEQDADIRKEISEATALFMPNVKIDKINIKHHGDELGVPELRHTITVSIDYHIANGNFDFTDNATLNF